MHFSGQNFTSILAYPTDNRSLDFVSQLGAVLDYVELWVGLDNRSIETWTTSNGGKPDSEIKWNGTGLLGDESKQCAYLDHASGG